MNNNNNNNSNNIKQDICAQQAKIITALRVEKQELIKLVERLERTEAEYLEFKSAFGTNGQTTYNEAMQSIMTRRNAEAKAVNDRMNYERQAKRDADLAEQRDADIKQVLADNPNLLKYCEERKAKIQQTKDKSLDLAERFYLLDTEQANQYIHIDHKPRESAVKHLLLEVESGDDVLGRGKLIHYECDYCNVTGVTITFENLAAFERHCWNEGDSHHDVNIERIDAEAFSDTAKVNAEYQADIDNAIRGKKDAAYQTSLTKQRAADNKAKQTLPFFAKST